MLFPLLEALTHVASQLPSSSQPSRPLLTSPAPQETPLCRSQQPLHLSFLGTSITASSFKKGSHLYSPDELGTFKVTQVVLKPFNLPSAGVTVGCHRAGYIHSVLLTCFLACLSSELRCWQIPLGQNGPLFLCHPQCPHLSW